MPDPFLNLPGAVADEEFGVPLHYGSPLSEQRALAEGDAIVSLSHRGVITVSGPDRLNWLDSMTSQRLLGLSAGESAETLLLDPNGRIEHAIRVIDDGERSWLLVDEGEAESLTAFLQRMRFALRVEMADVSDYSPRSSPSSGGSALRALAVSALAVAEWRDPWGEAQPGGAQYARGEHAGTGWVASQLVFSRADLPRLRGSCGRARCAPRA